MYGIDSARVVTYHTLSWKRRYIISVTNRMETFERQQYRFSPEGENRSVSLWTRRAGAGDQTVLFLHGLGGCGEAFERSTDAFPASKWHVFVPDLPGHGLSGSETWYPYSPEWYRDLLLSLIGEMDEEPEVIIGHSMGGTIALLLCEALSSGVFLLSVEGLPETLEFLDRRVRRYGALDGEEGLRRVREEFRNVTDPGIRTWLNWTEQCHPDAFFRSARRFVDLWREHDMMARFRAYPANRRFYVCGEKGQADYVRKQLSRDEYDVISGAAHFPMVTRPDAFWQLIGRVVRERV